jgi:hypothetical protein
VLMYYADPVDAVRRLARHLRPLGLMVFQEFDMEYVRSEPAASTFERSAELMKWTLRATGTRIRLGTELYSVFRAAGLPSPSLRMDIMIGGGAAFPGTSYWQERFRACCPLWSNSGSLRLRNSDFQLWPRGCVMK